MKTNDHSADSTAIQVASAPEVINSSIAEFDWYANSSKYRKNDGLINRLLARFGWRITRDATLDQKNKIDRWGSHAAELHHHSYGRPWYCGRDYFEMLISRGFKPSDVLLDFGCGAMRMGIWAAGYQDAGHYFGIDSHRASLDAAAEYEIPLHGLESKSPQLLHSTEFRVELFQKKFTVVFVASVFSHLTEEQQVAALDRIQAVCEPGCRLFVFQSDVPLTIAQLENRGIKLVDTFEFRSRFKGKTNWHEFRVG